MTSEGWYANMHSITYTSGTTGEVINLNQAQLRAPQIHSMRARAWSYTLSGRKATGRARSASEVELDITSLDYDELTRFVDLADNDFANDKDGILTINGEWFQHVAIGRDQLNGTANPILQQIKMTVILLDGVWRRETVRTVKPCARTQSDQKSLDFPVSFPFDYMRDNAIPPLINHTNVPIPVGFRVYGQAYRPSVRLGSNTYQINTLVPDGAVLTVDPIRYTVTIKDRSGIVTSVFDKAERGTGEGSGIYIFEKLPAGTTHISWSNAFAFDIITYEERTALPWNSLS